MGSAAAAWVHMRDSWPQQPWARAVRMAGMARCAVCTFLAAAGALAHSSCRALPHPSHLPAPRAASPHPRKGLSTLWMGAGWNYYTRDVVHTQPAVDG
jgi:hypothetical protein